MAMTLSNLRVVPIPEMPGICWYCHWGWAEPVAAIYTKYVELTAYEGVLDHGPAHIVWDDENFDDDSINFCLKEVADNPSQYSLSDLELELVRKSLVELQAIPESVRCCEPDDYDGIHPENFPPTVPVVKDRLPKSWD